MGALFPCRDRAQSPGLWPFSSGGSGGGGGGGGAASDAPPASLPGGASGGAPPPSPTTAPASPAEEPPPADGPFAPDAGPAPEPPPPAISPSGAPVPFFGRSPHAARSATSANAVARRHVESWQICTLAAYAKSPPRFTPTEMVENARARRHRTFSPKDPRTTSARVCAGALRALLAFANRRGEQRRARLDAQEIVR